ncbi:hypothetical protein [Hyphomonas pacifica]|uniref:hypothetical protein n=1 Tax=Hyphomonas pacifica TaxID=1280941 RepID=UPI000DBF7913|nr:hypothetical protein [Hyphomonas pacifica]RAN37878.1 hypothetical protein HY11_08305 [Hyphomonas pacifica]
MPAARIAAACLMALSLLAACGQQAPAAPASATTETSPSQSPTLRQDTPTLSQETRPAPDQPELEALSGRWISDDDPQAGMIITGDQLEMTYGGGTLNTEHLDIVETCGATTATKDIPLIKTTSGDGEALCYSVLEISDSKLVLSYLACGNTLSYSRARQAQ